MSHAGWRRYGRTQNLLITALFIGDVATCLLALAASYYVRFHTGLRDWGPTPPSPQISLQLYLPLIIVGTVFLMGTYTYFKLYDPRFLLRPLRSAEKILRGTVACFVIFTGVSFILKFEPSISRFFTAIAFLTTLLMMVTWRYGFHQWLLRTDWRMRLSQRLAFIGWSADAARLAHAMVSDPSQAYHACGMVATQSSASERVTAMNLLGSLEQLDALIIQHRIDTVILVDLELPREDILRVAAVCERRYVDFKIIPSFFQIFLSGLKTETIAGVPILGVSGLPLDNPLYRSIKRLMDIVGALVGLIISAPIVLVLAILIKRESPGPIFYGQIRTGRAGRPFTIYKLRSMRVDAERDGRAQWATPNDPRRLKIGAFMREWNLDELPQFWNVLKGDMSLVGPRPERPELIEQFEKTIRNYHPRHEVRPGMTGWAQVNGLRGNTSLSERIRYDLFYIENWSITWDIQILILTFLRHQNAY